MFLLNIKDTSGRNSFLSCSGFCALKPWRQNLDVIMEGSWHKAIPWWVPEAFYCGTLYYTRKLNFLIIQATFRWTYFCYRQKWPKTWSTDLYWRKSKLLSLGPYGFPNCGLCPAPESFFFFFSLPNPPFYSHPPATPNYLVNGPTWTWA